MYSFDPSAYLHVANELAQDGREAWLRTAVSRAYYGAFMIARDVMGVTVRNGLAHRQTRDRLVRHGKEMAAMLSTLHGLRKKADYARNIKVRKKDAIDALSIASDLHRSLALLKGTLERQRSGRQSLATSLP